MSHSLSSSPLHEPLRETLQLALVPGVGPRIRRALLARFGSSAAALSATDQQLRSAQGVGRRLSQAIREARSSLAQVDRLLQVCDERRIRVLTEADAEYPRLLREIPDPPVALFVRGECLSRDALSVAVVGSRRATHYGLRQAERLSRELVNAGMTVVSGLARGIDAAAHRGALAADGRTLAVLGSGVLNIYPPEHQPLADQIVGQGALLSENPPFRAPKSGSFPQRNRLVTGLCLGVIVIEASSRSGALISARHALEQGREVFAMPGRVDSPMSRGCHQLLRDGARLVECVDDVIEELGPLVEPTSRADGEGRILHPAELQLNDQETKVLNAIGVEPTLIDEVMADCGLPIPQVLATLSVLEMKRLIRRPSGCHVTRF